MKEIITVKQQLTEGENTRPRETMGMTLASVT